MEIAGRWVWLTIFTVAAQAWLSQFSTGDGLNLLLTRGPSVSALNTAAVWTVMCSLAFEWWRSRPPLNAIFRVGKPPAPSLPVLVRCYLIRLTRSLLAPVAFHCTRSANHVVKGAEVWLHTDDRCARKGKTCKSLWTKWTRPVTRLFILRYIQLRDHTSVTREQFGGHRLSQGHGHEDGVSRGSNPKPQPPKP